MMRKRIVFPLVTVVLVLIIIETGSFFLYQIIKQQIFPYAQYKEAINKITVQSNPKLSERPINIGEMRWTASFVEAIHPYIGFVADPRKSKATISEYGFLDSKEPIISRSDDKIIIGLFGGSFARQLFSFSMEELEKALAPLGKKLIIVNFAMGGYKQPQQLMILTYMLSLGAEFDIAINLDGFNEVALPPANINYGVFPMYPRGWSYRVGNLQSPELLKKFGKLKILDDERLWWGNLFENVFSNYSVALSIIWKFRDSLLEKARFKLIQQIDNDKETTDTRYVVTGPDFAANKVELYHFLAMSWKRSSFQMDNICKSNGIQYLHFLQPNQYVNGSKPLSIKEKKIAINSNSPYFKHATKGYSVLLKYGAELYHEGVRFYDLTMIYSKIEKTLYRDDCCHVNKAGYDIVARRIGDTIIQNYKKIEILKKHENY